MPDFPYTIYIPHIPTQLEALRFGFRLLDEAVKIAADQVVEAGAAVMADEAEQRRQRGPTIDRKRRARRARGRGRADD
jgi:hypothetical protein